MDIIVRTRLFTLRVHQVLVMDITPRKISQVITLLEHTSLTQRQIAEQCEVSLGSVNNIIQLKTELDQFLLKEKVFVEGKERLQLGMMQC